MVFGTCDAVASAGPHADAQGPQSVRSPAEVGTRARLAGAGGRSYQARMDRTWLGGRIALVQEDITRLAVDAIVNAANTSLLGGGGVDGAIHRAAGPGLLEECRAIRNRQGGCRTGQAVLTGGHRLPARHVIHTVGPVWQGGTADEDALLASCYRESLGLAEARGCRTLAFPAISTGVYGFPADRAAGIAVGTCRAWLVGHALPESITLVAFDAHALATLQSALEKEP